MSKIQLSHLVEVPTDWHNILRIFKEMHYHEESCTLWLHPNKAPTDTMVLFKGTFDEFREHFVNFFMEKDFTPWWNREFSISVHKVCSGPACGKQNLVFKNKAGFTIGFIQPTYLDFGTGSCSLAYVVHRSCQDYRTSVALCLSDAFQELGVSHIDLRDIEERVDAEFWRTC